VPTALLSVYDKSGIVEFARGLHDLGWDLISSGGTAREVAAAGIPVTDVADLTGFPAILGHRVVTLHPKVHGGLLADPTDPSHQSDLAEYGITPISLAVINLYPFGSDPSIELIDVGGPTMVRAAAKNHAHVGVVVDPSDYTTVLNELRDVGELSGPTRRRLARAAFAHIAAYDAAIVTWLDATDPEPQEFAPTIHLTLERPTVLRYGENPHQAGRALRRGRSAELVGPDGSTRRKRTELSQRARHRGCLASREFFCRTGLCDREACQSLRGGPR
jgi:phosphoribosylaminoimidazolecarboxamide formyltransferase / IMP cyclohydrolase